MGDNSQKKKFVSRGAETFFFAVRHLFPLMVPYERPRRPVNHTRSQNNFLPDVKMAKYKQHGIKRLEKKYLFKFPLEEFQFIKSLKIWGSITYTVCYAPIQMAS